MLFINTRPKDRAAPLTQALNSAGYDVAELPLLELLALPFSEELQQLYQQLSDTQVIVVVSPTAVEIGMQYLQQAGLSLQQLSHIQWIAVGQRTAQCLADYGIVSHVPEVESSEGMLQLPMFQSGANLNKIAFWRGLGGRQFMMQHLQQHGVELLNFVLYQRQCPEQTVNTWREIAQRISAQQSIVVLISSEASWYNWQQLLKVITVDGRWRYFTLGERLSHLVAEAVSVSQQHADIVQLKTLTSSEMMHYLQQ